MIFVAVSLGALAPGAAAASRPSVSAPRVTEGDAGTRPAAFRVTLAHAATRPVRLRFATRSGTAGSGDFVARTGLLHFGRGARVRTIRVNVRGDTEDEPDETFSVLVGATRATARIIDDDGPSGSPPPSPFTDRTQATFVLDFLRMRIQQCFSQNDGRPANPPTGVYAELETRYTGTVVSQDKRLQGKIELLGKGLARAEPDDGPFLPDTGQAGLVRGPFTITADADHRKTRGQFYATVGRSASPADPGVLQFEGLLQGGVDYLPSSRRTNTNDTDFDGGQLIANFRGSSSNWTGDQVRGDIGGLPPTDDTEQPAFIQGGDCGGPVQLRKRGDPPFVPMPTTP